MEIRDPIHGSIHILDEVIPVLSADFFQRLRNIKQLGFSEYIFPGATHTRLLHSIGVMCVGEKAFDNIFSKKLENKEVQRIKETFKLACLLHDTGHAPLSHATESVMPPLKELKIPKGFLFSGEAEDSSQATHEDYTVKAIADSSFALAFKKIEDKFGVKRKHIAELIVGRTRDPAYFAIDGINYFPLLHQLISSELDCDRMDYLLRDSYFCGVSYGNFDLDWLIDNMSPCVINNTAYMGISERAIVTFNDFLLSRFHMFLMVYFHYRAVCLEQLLHKYFLSSPNEYTIPADIEKYVEHDDHLLLKALRNSNDKYAQAIVKNNIPAKIFESFNEDQLQVLEKIQEHLDQENIEYIKCSSRGRLSKYYNGTNKLKEEHSIKVIRNFYGKSKTSHSNIEEATDLFQKFSQEYAVTRLHCDLDKLPATQKKNIMELIQTL